MENEKKLWIGYLKSYEIEKVVQICHDVVGNFIIHIWACPGDFIIINRWTGNFVLM